MKNSTPASLQRRQHRKARHVAQRQAQRRHRRRAAAAQPSRGQAVLYELFTRLGKLILLCQIYLIDFYR